jgi:hypothetical protein
MRMDILKPLTSTSFVNWIMGSRLVCMIGGLQILTFSWTTRNLRSGEMRWKTAGLG